MDQLCLAPLTTCTVAVKVSDVVDVDLCLVGGKQVGSGTRLPI